MRLLRVLLIYLIVVILGGALLAPWLYWLAQSLASTFPGLATTPFHRFLNRSLLGAALVGLWPLFRSVGVRSPREFGLVRPAGQMHNLGNGFALGFISLLLVAVLALAFGARHLSIRIPPEKLVKKLIHAALTAGLVAVLEEILFRGAFFGTLRRVWHWVFALALSSMFYGIVHFMDSARAGESITWLSGIELLPRMLQGFTNWQAVIPGFFTLTLAGVILGLAYQRTGNLYFSIGLHAGWIFWRESYGILTLRTGASSRWWWGSMRLVDGWMALAVLTGTLLLFVTIVPPAGTKQDPPA